MPAGMAHAIHTGSEKGVLTIGSSENDYEWVLRFTISTTGPNAATHTQDVVIGGGDAEFADPLGGTTLTFDTNDIIEVDNDESIDTGNWEIVHLTMFIRELGQTIEQVVIPQTMISVMIEPTQVLRITQITLEVND